MSENDGLRRYLEAGLALTHITRSRAEELVRELIKTGELERHRAQDWAEDLVKASRERSEALVATVRAEVRRQLKELGFTNVDDLAKRVAAILAKSSQAARNATGRRPVGPAATKAAARPSTAKKPGAKKASGAKAAAKKASAKKASA